ncbi:Holliday junction branch migration DNA helicase RuvB [Microgenomates group bacterium]|nr:Holliday junction branch migration DNA helicase RuvB [Microgenomates group bacterium]
MIEQLASTTPEEERLIDSLRASSWQEFYGQEKIKRAITIGTCAAAKRSQALDHVLLYGPPGLGKTTLAHLIAHEMNSNIKITSGTALSKTGDLAAILTSLEEKDILFIDEIHRLPKTIEETLYPAMEDYALDIVLGKGASARTVRLDLPHFTLVGATTRFGALSGPFRDRFGLIYRLNFYPLEELTIILQKAAQKLKLPPLDKTTAALIATRGRGTPRIALKLLKRVRDFVEVNFAGQITPEIATQALDLLEVDQLGLTEHDRFFLTTLINKHRGGPVGLSTIAATISEDALTIEEVIEPYLLQIGFLQKTPKGRLVSKAAYQHLGIK